MRQVTNLTFEQYEKLWKMFVDALSGLLRACEGRYEEGTPTAHRLTQLSVEAGFLHVAMALAHPSRITSYHFSMGRVWSWMSLGSLVLRTFLHVIIAESALRALRALPMGCCLSPAVTAAQSRSMCPLSLVNHVLDIISFVSVKVCWLK